MFPIIPSNGAVTGFQIANSLRFRSSASAYLSRTPGVAGSRTTWTWSGWVKRGIVNAADNQALLSGGTVAGTNDVLRFSADTFDAYLLNASSVVGRLTTTQVFRDPSSWYHLVFVWDTTNATSTDRMRLYVNGSRVTAFSTATYPALNATSNINNNVTQYVGALNNSGIVAYLDGYLAEINFIDGQALTPSSFGETDALTGVWKPKAYSGAYGTNGFRLNFSNGTSTTTLGYDSSGNGNNWTPNNISLTAGSTYDWMIDSPTKFPGSSYGVGNYATLNPLWNTSPSTHLISSGNLKITQSGAGSITLYSTFGAASGAYYFEVNASTVAGDCFIGVSQSSGSFGANSAIANGAYRSDGTIFNGSTWVAYGATYTTGDVIGVAFNIGSNTINFYKNNVAQGQKSITFVNTTVAAIYSATSGNVLDCNFGQRPFAYTPPTGFKALNTQNLPAPSIANGANHMAATTYTGNGATQTIVNAYNSVSFQPDFVWLKDRSAAENHELQDSVRGATKLLKSNTTDAELTAANTLTAFNGNGFSLGNSTEINRSADNYVGWQWKAGGTAVTNTAGSITSSVSANTTAGFSVATFTCNVGGSGTFGHGLGVAPSMVIIKSRTSSIQNWVVGHTSIAWTNYLLLNATVASSANSTVWNNTAPSSTVVTLGSGFTNASYGDCVAYCFAAIPGYSAFGSYTGNGSSDGPFVFTGMRPRWIMVKRTDAVEVWVILDTSRNTYNIVSEALFANTSDSTYSASWLDVVSNGFKIRNSGTGSNASGGTYIYAAFAENPFQNALAR